MRSIAEIVADALADVAERERKASEPQIGYERLGHVPGGNPDTRFVPPPPQPAKARGYHYVFCTHNKPYWQTCSKCGRDKELARRNADIVLKAVGGAAFFTK